MTATINDILGRRNLGAVFQTVLAGIPRGLPASFFNVTRQVNGNTTTFTKYDGARKAAQITAYGAQARVVSKKGIGETPVTLLHSFEEMRHQAATLMNLRAYEDESRQNMGIQELARHSRDFAERFMSLRTIAIQSAILTGNVYFAEDGTALPSSSGATVSIDYGIPASNRNQLNIDGTGAKIAASWATTSTDIQSHMTGIKNAALAATNYPIRHAFHGANIRTYLRNNDNLQIQMQSNSDLSRNIGGSSDFEWEGIVWHDASSLYWVQEDGTINRFVGADGIVFMPEPSASWYELVEGSHPVPKSLDVMRGDAADIAANIDEVFGPASWAKITDNPVGISHFHADTFLPIIGNPNAIYIADVTP